MIRKDNQRKGKPRLKMRVSLKQILRHGAPWDLSLRRAHTLYAKLTQILTLRANNINVL